MRDAKYYTATHSEFLSALELGFIILSVHYISSAASAPFNAIYQSPVLPSFFFLF